ncbi:hypothetical protein WQ54_09565 [Bacillus sp. SA1-12]|uniref:YfmQ family protein n=1 Tax=Bacillus sp. SA1-12 TaxID=1455638 RepID=UPI0006264244|nr:YfmQ family protein [Bacillus sp. SA1-12]KKI92441.1 hypothetical protein WQ54_09565 [Bacillus sp. SA1-12]
MTWTFIVMLTLFALAKIVVTCLPTGVVEWLISKFELHPTLHDTSVTVTIDGKSLEGDDKNQVIHSFNEALFIEKYYGNPENNVTPLVIDVKNGKNKVRFFVYSYTDHVNVIKIYKRKTVAYCLRSEGLQTNNLLNQDII